MGKTVQRNRGEVVSVLRDRRNWPLQNVRVPVMIFIRKTGAIYIFGDAPDSREVIQQFAQKPSSSRARRTSRTWKSCLICSRTTRTCRTPTTTGRPRTKPYIARVSAVLGNQSVVIYDALTAIYITTSAAIYSGGCFL